MDYKILISNEELLEKYEVYKASQNNERKFAVAKERSKKRKRKKRGRKTRRDYKKTYHNYLKSKEWKMKKEEFFKFLKSSGLKKVCDICGGRYRLAVHHQTYANIFNEDMYDLQLLCKKCHDKEHK